MVAFLGVIVAFAALLGGNYLEGGQVASLLDLPAAIIVLGGTLGAVMLQTPSDRITRALKMLQWLARPPVTDNHIYVPKFVDWCKAARRDGVLGLEKALEKEADPFLRKGLQLLIDGGDAHSIRRALETDAGVSFENDMAAARTFRSMGGYAPTIGIVGAVLALIQVMANLGDPSELGRGIATAFVATIYGVGTANLLFLPVAERLSELIRRIGERKQMAIEGLYGIAEGEHPRTLEVQLRGFLR